MKFLFLLPVLMLVCYGLRAQKNNYQAAINTSAGNIEEKVIAWRHDFHHHPEPGSREERTSVIIAKHLQSLGFEVRTGVAVTGVAGILKGDKAGPVVALRADMDALPVTEKRKLPLPQKCEPPATGITAMCNLLFDYMEMNKK